MEMSVIKVGHVSLNVTDLNAAEKFYTEVLGLTVSARRDGEVYLRTAEDQDHHNIVLKASDSAGLDHVGLKVNSPDDLEELETLVLRTGTQVWRVSDREEVGQGEGVRFVVPSGQTFEVFYHIDNLGYEVGMENPDPVTFFVGAKAARLDHLLISAADAEDNQKFFTEILDFGASEVLRDPEGKIIASWMYCTTTMHDVAMSPGPEGGLHHVALWLDSRADVVRAVNWMKKNKVRTFDYGITRHGISGATTIYFHDPAGNRLELFTGPYVTPGVPGRVKEITWTLDQFPRGVFYYERELDMKFFEDLT
ncbi:MAG: Catechol 2,3-dioxygenase [Hydrogenibacillus schlegelii]|uniref:Catechol 2,3-dioxygenase n=2 Tax=Hydrogenibacillus schlegelii TaxID=1484 RepID=A0A2T5G5C1_HYDSH|nr:MAG: Catechol 2,3-dioxygenase [Hydrogenibacillus schlegelii]